MTEPKRDPDPVLWQIIDDLTSEQCARLLGIPENEEVMLADARDLVREAYQYGSLDAEDICFP